TNVLSAGPEPPGPAGIVVVAGLVSRVSVTPLTVIVADALPVTSPAEGDVKVTVHTPPTVPAPAQVSELTRLAAPLLLVGVTVGCVRSGTATNPLPSAEFCLTVTVKVCGALTSLVAVGGVIVMLASTKVFTAGPVPPGPEPMVAVAGSVSRVRATPPTV